MNIKVLHIYHQWFRIPHWILGFWKNIFKFLKALLLWQYLGINFPDVKFLLGGESA